MIFKQISCNTFLKIAVLFLIIIFFSNSLLAQDYKYASEVKLQKKALEILVDTIKTKHKKIIKKDTLFISTEKYFSSRLPDNINGINICYLNSDDTKKQQRDSIFMLGMSPLKTSLWETLDIEFTLYYVTLKPQTKYFQNSKGKKFEEPYYEELFWNCGGGGTASFLFDCKTNDFALWHFSFTMAYCAEY